MRNLLLSACPAPLALVLAQDLFLGACCLLVASLALLVWLRWTFRSQE